MARFIRIRRWWGRVLYAWKMRGGVEAYYRRCQAGQQRRDDLAAARAVGISRWQLFWMHLRPLRPTRPIGWEVQGEPTCPRCGTPMQLYRPPTDDQPEVRIGFCRHQW